MHEIIDIHPHIVSDDAKRYPHNPMHSVKASHWTVSRPVTIEGLIAAMDKASVAKAALVQAASCYSYDNSYLCDALVRFPGRFTGVGCVDLLKPEAVAEIRTLVERGVSGLRMFTATSSGGFDLGLHADTRLLQVWKLCGETGLSMSLQADPTCLVPVAELAKRFPKVKFVLDHLARPEVSDGPPYAKAAGLFSLAPIENIYLKLTPRIMEDSRREAANPETFFPLLVERFGSDRLAWGSNYPASDGDYTARLNEAKGCLASVSTKDRDWIFGKTAQRLYPRLAN